MKPPAALQLSVWILLLGWVRSAERLQAKPVDESQLIARHNSHVSEDQAGDALPSSNPGDSPSSNTASSSSIPTDAPTTVMTNEASRSSTPGYSFFTSVEKELKNITDDILMSVSRQDIRCLSVCNKVLAPACVQECRRRGVSPLMCRLICYSTEIRCCQCPVLCHDPFLQCYLSCHERNTPCKDVCLDRVNFCCDQFDSV